MKIPRITSLVAAIGLMVGTPAWALAYAAPSPAAHGAAAHPPARHVPALSPNVQRLLAWVKQSKDNRGAPFAVIDKRNARLLVFEPGGRLRGSAPVLLGLAKGDDTVPGIGERQLSDIKPEERTTPAGRFVAEHGTNARGEDVIWIDYDAAVSMHRVLTTNPKEHRLQRLATPTVADNRVSYGCVNVPKAFFERAVLKTLNVQRPIVYVLPETRPLGEVFAGMQVTRPTGIRTSSLQPPLTK